MKCILIQTKENRKIITSKKNFKHILEYAKTFKAKIFEVKVNKNQKILSINNLITALCDKNYKINNLDFEILGTKFNKKILINKKRSL